MKPWLRIKRRHLWIAIPRGEDAVAALALAAFLGVAIFGLTHSYDQQRESYKQRDESQSASADRGQSTTGNQESYAEDKTPEWYSAAADWVLVLVATITAWAALRTLKSINRDVRASTRAAKAAESSAAVAQAAIILTHRPKVILRNIELPHIEHGNYTQGTIWATNVGDTVAHVIKFDTQWFVGQKLPMKNPYARIQPTKTNRKSIPPGSSQHFVLPDVVVQDGQEMTLHIAVHQEERYADDPSLYLIGVLKYRDELRNLRRTGFCRRYDRRSKRFVRVDDPEYEYAD